MRFFKFKTLAGLGLLASIGLCSHAEGFVAGAKATGMAAASIAYPQDAYAGATNPAGMVDVGDRLDFGVFWAQDRGHIHGSGNVITTGPDAGLPNPLVNKKYDSFKTKDIYFGDFAINRTFCSEICGKDVTWAVGLVGYNRDYQKTSYTKPLVLLGTTEPGLEYLHETFAPVFAVSFNDLPCGNNLSFGVSVDVHVQRLKVNGLQNFTITEPIQFSLYPNHVTNKGYDYASGIGATFGFKWDINDCLAVGVTYRTKAKMSHFHKYKGFLAERGLLCVPQKVAGGFAWKFLPCATLAFDVEWIDWSQIVALHNPLINKRQNPNVPPFLTPLGSKHGPGFGFREQVFYRVGVDYAVNDCWTVRAGYRYANTPVKRTQTAVNLLTCDLVESFITVGATYTWNCCAELSMFYAYGFPKRVKGKDSIPVFLGGGNIDLEESKDALGISFGYIF